MIKYLKRISDVERWYCAFRTHHKKYCNFSLFFIWFDASFFFVASFSLSCRLAISLSPSLALSVCVFSFVIVAVSPQLISHAMVASAQREIDAPVLMVTRWQIERKQIARILTRTVSCAFGWLVYSFHFSARQKRHCHTSLHATWKSRMCLHGMERPFARFQINEAKCETIMLNSIIFTLTIHTETGKYGRKALRKQMHETMVRARQEDLYESTFLWHSL